MAELKELVVAGPDLQRDGVVRWRCVDLQELIASDMRPACMSVRWASCCAEWA